MKGVDKEILMLPITKHHAVSQSSAVRRLQTFEGE